MRRFYALALSLVALAACSDVSTAPRAARSFTPRPSLDAVALNDAIPADTAMTVVIAEGDARNFEEAVLVKLGLSDATGCRSTQPEVGFLNSGWLVGAVSGETLLVCNGGRHTRLASEEGEDAPTEAWAWAPFAILVRVEPQ